MKKYTTWSDAFFEPSVTIPEKVDPITLTQPDMSLTIDEILLRSKRGLSINAAMGEPLYHGENDFSVNIRTLDHADRAAIIKQHREKIKAMQADLQAQKLAIEQKRQKAYDDAIINNYLARQKAQQAEPKSPATQP